ncbi:MAG: dual specificity protein phosphatase family protein [Marinicellaceae bacterium]
MTETSGNSDLLFLHKQWDKTVFTYPLKRGSINMMPKPPGSSQLPSYIQFLKSKSIDIVVSLLQYQEIMNHALTNEGIECEEHGIEFINFPIKDHSNPQFFLPFNQLIEQLVKRIEMGKNIAIHCYAGIGRTGLVAASILIKQGMQVDEALISLSRARGLRVPETIQQITWLHHHFEELKKLSRS